MRFTARHSEKGFSLYDGDYKVSNIVFKHIKHGEKVKEIVKCKLHGRVYYGADLDHLMQVINFSEYLPYQVTAMTKGKINRTTKVYASDEQEAMLKAQEKDEDAGFQKASIYRVIGRVKGSIEHVFNFGL